MKSIVTVALLLACSTFTAAQTCGTHAYQCPVPDGRAIGAACTACCCEYGYVASSGCDCIEAPKVPTPTPTAGAQAVCGSNAYSCPVPDARNHTFAGCGTCCCEYGYTPVASAACGCQPATPTPTPIPGTPTPTPVPTSVCLSFAYQCNGTSDDRGITSGCAGNGCCCNFGYTPIAGTCGCQVPSKSISPSTSPSPVPGAVHNTCGTWAYQCNSTSDSRGIPSCNGCCCNFGFIPGSGCNCTTPTPTPTPLLSSVCLANTYQCNSSADSRGISGCNCCCNYGYTPATNGSCMCFAPSPTPSVSVGASPSPGVKCLSNAYQCSANEDRNITGCPGCCCNYGFVSANNGSCICIAPSKSPSPTPGASPTTCGLKSYQCAVGDSNANSNCPGCCCNYGTVPVGAGSCACTITPTPVPTPTVAGATCGVKSFQCAVGSADALSSCGTSSFGCCCFYGYVRNGSTCGCVAATPTPTPNAAAVTNACGTNSFNCGGVGNANQPALVGVSTCTQCCCFWGYNQIASTCTCGK